MTRDEARGAIRANWESIIKKYTGTAQKRVAGHDTYICPFCGHGTHGDGITTNPKSADGYGLKCFGACGFSGDIIDLIRQHDGIDYDTALKKAAAELGIDIEPYYRPPIAGRKRRTAPQEAEKQPRKAAGGKIPTGQAKAPGNGAREQEAPEITDYEQFYRECAANIEDPAALAYLQTRGISVETAARFNLGYDPAWISPTGMKTLQEQGKTWRPAPTPRIIVPVTSNCYIARATDPGDTPPKMHETGGGSMGMFNMQALHSGADVVFICEGVFDALAVIECGGQAVALNSTAMSEHFLQELEAEPTAAALAVFLDNDESGREAAHKIGQGLERMKVQHVLADIPGGHHDPNEALQTDRAAFTEAIRAIKERARAAEIPTDTQSGAESDFSGTGGEMSAGSGKTAENGTESAEPSKDGLANFWEKVQTTAYKPHKTGLKFFDDLLGGGIIPQSVILILAAPAAGKTTLCQQIAEAMAERGQPFIYLNFEMSREQMLAKSISARAARDHNCKLSTMDVLQGYRWTEEQRQAVTAAMEDYRAHVFPFLQYNPDGVTSDLQDIRQYLQKQGDEARRAHRPAPAICLDYLHLISTRERLDVQELLKQAIGTIKGYCMRYNTFALVISATNRNSNSDGRITLESGRDSSNLEYTADAQIGLNYVELDNRSIRPAEAEKVAALQRKPYRHMILRVLKSRFYQAGRSEKCYFHAATNRFFSENEFLPGDGSEAPEDFDEEEPKQGTDERL